MIWHTPPLFEVFRFAFCPDEPSWQANRVKVIRAAAVDLRVYPHPQASGMFTCWRDAGERPHGVITISERFDRSMVDIIGILTHECVHLVEAIFDAAREEEPGEETRAYLTEHCVKTIWTDYAKTRGANPT